MGVVKQVLITVGDGSVNINNEVMVSIGAVCEVIYDRANLRGFVKIEIGGVIEEFSISLKAAYMLVMLLPPKSWVDI
uniref:Uncharacterized protein n=1 Tax=Curvibacter symbiont subsp. Hydra magnipapillata TaxID=667019 RepID=C9Y6T8_CURXX|nr:hypothetical protein Csp_E36650 [Curvibacter putative symbiont of Hydra magnipapillata]